MKEKLDKIRVKIDSLDSQLLEILEQRLSVVSQVASIKKAEEKVSYIKADREDFIIKFALFAIMCYKKLSQISTITTIFSYSKLCIGDV